MYVVWVSGYLENISNKPTYDKPFKVWWFLLVPHSLTLKISAFSPQSVFCVLPMILRISGIISLNSISRLVFVMNTRCFFSHVASEFLSR
jgi:hypothetical protein